MGPRWVNLSAVVFFVIPAVCPVFTGWEVVEVRVTGFLEFELDGANSTQVAAATRSTMAPQFADFG